MHDLVIRNGTIVDGTGAAPFVADLAIDNGRISVIGRVGTEARETIDATGLIVTPGFVDVHTHYDGQVTWDPELSPSSWHGVTTVVMGNCGVGFAPARPDKHDWLIGLMEGVEDIPGTALSEGITWGWESFPEYLDVIGAQKRAIDVAGQVSHGAVRSYVMGDRGARNEPATADDIASMARIVQEAIEAGAVGFSTSRTIVHRAVDGEPVPGTFAADDELNGLGGALKAAGRGIFEVAPAGVSGEDIIAPEKELAWMRRVADETDRPVSYLLIQNDQAPDLWRKLLDLTGDAVDAGAPIRPQVGARPTGVLMGLQNFHPFRARAAYLPLADLAIDEKVRRMREPAVRRAILDGADLAQLPTFLGMGRDKMFPLGDPPDYEPGPDGSIAAMAARSGVDADEVLYDQLLESEGREFLYRPLLGYSDGNFDPIYDMLVHPSTALGLSDGGAHCGVICDASMPTTMLTHWVRDRSRGQRLSLEGAVRKMTSDTAALFGFTDRGAIKVGMKADINVIDHARLTLHRPEMVFDLPAGARRLVQRASGYVATIVSGQIIRRNDEATGAMPGQLVRSH